MIHIYHEQVELYHNIGYYNINMEYFQNTLFRAAVRLNKPISTVTRTLCLQKALNL